ncbi:MAG TPA: cation diffusion facilitator family transporter [bacterium]|jgi:cobalt-zinc-cadmium efflux system protein|nr:cation diffusion facilitator family transporter [bacterium]
MSSDHSHHDGHHGHSHDHSHPSRNSRMIWAIGITGSILILEAVGGILSGSLALLSDAGHMLTDLAALLISLAAMVMAEKPVSPRHTYGLARLEVLAALGNSITFFLMVAGVGWEALNRFTHPTLPDWRTMGIIATIGLLANVMSAWFLHGAHEKDLNMQSAWVHVMGDLASSVGVLVGVFVIAKTGWTWVDPILSLGICLLIALSAFKLFMQALHILLESAPKDLTPEKINSVLTAALPEIQEVHHIHLWEVGSGEIHITAHLVLKDQSLGEAKEILVRAAEVLKDRCGIQHATLQPEVPTRIMIRGPEA